MASATATQLLVALRQFHVLEPGQFDELSRNLQDRSLEPRALARELLAQNWLTAYQANLLLQGRGQELVLGSYVLMERLGEGGMGAVFKARNWKLGTVVALKVIRKDRIASTDAIRRFQREIRAAAQLDHPNIVRAFDADEVAGTHVLVMEFVEGTDLSKLVKQQGPLPINQACDYILQAALGLQHAFEKGLIHRDIKPANLLVARNAKREGASSPLRVPRSALVKILDMGLARLDAPGADGESTSMLTQEGTIMGTPDYIAPEQAMGAHDVDIRADLYSLGCTMYFLLTGRPPFPGGTLGAKLVHHRMDEPEPVRKLRPEVSPALAGVVRRLMAKRPEDRFQTPAEVADALTAAASGIAPPERSLIAEASGDAVNQVFASMAAGDTVEERKSQQRPAGQCRWLLLSSAGGAGLLMVMGALVFLFSRHAQHATPTQTIVEQPSKSASSVEKKSARSPEPAAGKKPPLVQALPGASEWDRAVLAMPAAEQVKTVARHLQARNPAFDGQVTHEINDGVVTKLVFLTDHVTDISPVRALAGLTSLRCGGSWNQKGSLADLSPLKGMKLTNLVCIDTRVSDLSPLKDMKLVSLSCTRTLVADLSPLVGMPLGTLYVGGTQVSDLTPLKDMNLRILQLGSTKVSDLSPLVNVKLTRLYFSATKVSDLSPLKNVRLTHLSCDRTPVTDLSPLAGMPLEQITCDFIPARDAELLRSIPTLTQINGKPVAEFWKEVNPKVVEASACLERGREFAKAGKWPEAEAEFTRAVLASPDNPQVWRQRGVIQAEGKRFDQAAADFAKALELIPMKDRLHWAADGTGVETDVAERDEVFVRVAQIRAKDNRLWIARARWFAQRGKWQEAADASARVRELSPTYAVNWFTDAVLRLQIGDVEGYRRNCREMLARFGKTENTNDADQTAKTCALASGAVEDLVLVVRLGDLGVEKSKGNPWCLLTQGLAHYRVGRWDRAAEALDKCLASQSSASQHSICHATARTILAMVQQQRGNPEEARASLKQTRALIEQKMPNLERGEQFDMYWHDWLRCQILLREAEALIEGKKEQPKK